MMTYDEILSWVRETAEARLADLWRLADDARQKNVGGDVHLHGLIEISNRCIRLCGYCGLRAPNQSVKRYRMTSEEIIACVRQGEAMGYQTVVLRSGEDPGITAESIVDLLRFIKSETSLVVTLSLGERTESELVQWREAGADRYLLRFETSSEELYERIHPSRTGRSTSRIEMLRQLQTLDYEVGSGVMIGIPGQSYEDLARDITLFAELGLDSIECALYTAHPNTPLGNPKDQAIVPGEDQVPSSESMSYKAIALSRLVCPRANIASTVAPATLNRKAGCELGLVRGANVVMPSLTPPQYRRLYEVYPDKACVNETAAGCQECLSERIRSIGRQLGAGRDHGADDQR